MGLGVLRTCIHGSKYMVDTKAGWPLLRNGDAAPDSTSMVPVQWNGILEGYPLDGVSGYPSGAADLRARCRIPDCPVLYSVSWLLTVRRATRSSQRTASCSSPSTRPPLRAMRVPRASHEWKWTAGAVSASPRLRKSQPDGARWHKRSKI